MRIARGDAYPSGSAAAVERAAPAVRDAGRAHRIGEQTGVHEQNFIKLAAVLRRRRGLILAAAALGAVLAGGVGLLIAPKYTAVAQIVIEPQQAESTGGPAAAGRGIDESAIDTQIMMLSSRDLFRRVLDSLSPARERAETTGETQAKAIAGDRADGTLSHPVDAGRRADVSESEAPELRPEVLGRRLKTWFDALFTRGDAGARELDELERQVKVIQERRSRVISVSVTAKSPERAAAIANRIAELRIAGEVDEMRRQVSAELARLGEGAAKLKGEMEQAKAAIERTLEHRLTAGVGDKEDEMRLRQLLRDAADDGQAYAGLVRRQKEIRDQRSSISPGAHVLTPASPPHRPSSPNPILFVLPALILSSICGSLVAVAMERLDQSLRCERDVADALGVPCIGLLPRLRGWRAARPHRYLFSRPFSPYSEAVRCAVAALQLEATPHGPLTVLITSSVPKEGKTTVAVSLAVLAAMLGRRVLLVDFDFSRASFLRRLRAKDERLAVELRGRPPAEFIRHLPELNVDYLPVPRSSVDPLAPFAAKYMQDLRRELRNSYDCVIIDGPPLLGIAEARLLAALVDKVLLVIKWGSTRRQLVQSALDLLRNPGWSGHACVGTPIALMTQVDLKRHASYRFGDAGECLANYSRCYRRMARSRRSMNRIGKPEQGKRVQPEAVRT